MTRRELTPVSYVVLGLLVSGPATSYELKRQVARTIGNFWEFNHSQLYDEPARLAAAELVTAHREEGGRRRRTYTITEAGRAAFTDWLAESSPSKTEVRDLGLLKLFFSGFGTSGDRIRLAQDQRQAHRERAAAHERQYAAYSTSASHSSGSSSAPSSEGTRTPGGPGPDSWALATLELGIRYEHMAAQFWDDLLRRHRPAGSDGE